MQYLVSVVHDAAGLATPDAMAAIDVFNDRLDAEGHWVFAGGLAAPDLATRKPARAELVKRLAWEGVNGGALEALIYTEPDERGFRTKPEWRPAVWRVMRAEGLAGGKPGIPSAVSHVVPRAVRAGSGHSGAPVFGR